MKPKRNLYTILPLKLEVFGIALIAAPFLLMTPLAILGLLLEPGYGASIGKWCSVRGGTVCATMLVVSAYVALLVVCTGSFVALCALLYRIAFLKSLSMDGAVPLGDLPVSVLNGLLRSTPFVNLVAQRRVWVDPRDFSIRARVVGVVAPRILISHGFKILLMRGDMRAIQVTCHEIAHILQKDTWVPGILLFSILVAALSVIQAVYRSISGLELSFGLVIYPVCYLLIVLSLVRRRENFADLYAAWATKSKLGYVELLDKFGSDTSIPFSLFHPSFEERRNFIRDFPRSLRISRRIILFLSLALFALGQLYLPKVFFPEIEAEVVVPGDPELTRLFADTRKDIMDTLFLGVWIFGLFAGLSLYHLIVDAWVKWRVRLE